MKIDGSKVTDSISKNQYLFIFGFISSFRNIKPKSMKKLITSTLIVVLLSLSANSQPLTTETTVFYETEEFSIEYPEAWELNTKGVMGSIFIIFSPLQYPADDFRDNLLLMKEDLSTVSMDLDGYVSLTETQLTTLLQDYSPLESKRLTKDGLTYHVLTYTGTQGSYDLKIHQYFWVVNETAYVMTFTCEQESIDYFDESIRKIMDSFKLNTSYISPKPVSKGEETENGDSKQFATDNYAIQYPNDWTLSSSDGKMGMEFILLAPRSGDEDQFNENITLAVEDLSGYDVALEYYVEVALSQINKIVTDGKVIYNEPKMLHETPYYHAISTGKQGGVSLTYDQFYWIFDGKAYIMTFTCPDVTFEEYQAIGEMIMSSFTVKE